MDFACPGMEPYRPEHIPPFSPVQCPAVNTVLFLSVHLHYVFTSLLAQALHVQVKKKHSFKRSFKIYISKQNGSSGNFITQPLKMAALEYSCRIRGFYSQNLDMPSEKFVGGLRGEGVWLNEEITRAVTAILAQP